MTVYTQYFFRHVAVLLVVLGMASGCDSHTANLTLPMPPPLTLTGFDPDVAAQIATAHKQWQANPLAAPANGELAMLLHSHKLLAAASAYYGRARQLDQDQFDWAYLHALVLAELGERDTAITALRHALALDSLYMPAQLKLAMLLADSGQDDESAALYAEILSAASNVPQALYGLGRLRMQQDDVAGVALLERATKVSGPYGEAHYALAKAYQKTGDTAKADAHFALFERRKNQQPPLIDPVLITVKDLNESKLGILDRGQRLLAQGKIQEATKQFELVLTKDPETAGAYSVLISTYGMSGQFDKAEAAYHKGVELNSDPVRLHNNFGILRLKQKRYQEAIAAFQDAIEADPEYIDAYVNLGAALESSGKRSEGIKYYRAALERDPTHRPAGFHLGNAYMRLSNPYRAAEQYRRILEPEDRMTPEYLHALAEAWLGMSKHAEAEGALERALAIAGTTGRTDLIPKLRSALQRAQNNEQP